MNLMLMDWKQPRCLPFFISLQPNCIYQIPSKRKHQTGLELEKSVIHEKAGTQTIARTLAQKAARNIESLDLYKTSLLNSRMRPLLRFANPDGSQSAANHIKYHDRKPNLFRYQGQREHLKQPASYLVRFLKSAKSAALGKLISPSYLTLKPLETALPNILLPSIVFGTSG